MRAMRSTRSALVRRERRPGRTTPTSSNDESIAPRGKRISIPVMDIETWDEFGMLLGCFDPLELFSPRDTGSTPTNAMRVLEGGSHVVKSTLTSSSRAGTSCGAIKGLNMVVQVTLPSIGARPAGSSCGKRVRMRSELEAWRRQITRALAQHVKTSGPVISIDTTPSAFTSPRPRKTPAFNGSDSRRRRTGPRRTGWSIPTCPRG
jgi:hypothetical protein